MWRRAGVVANQSRSARRLRQTEGLDREPILDPFTASSGAASVWEASDRDDRLSMLTQALDSLRASHPAGVYSASRMINPVLDVWSLAASVDHAVARPIERLLTALVVRYVVTSAELRTAIDEVETVISRLSVV